MLQELREIGQESSTRRDLSLAELQTENKNLRELIVRLAEIVLRQTLSR
jgi:hypothetical protein